MRSPTPIESALAWHSAALANPDLPRTESDPQPGWYKAQLVKGGPWLAVRIWIEAKTCPGTGELTEPEVLRATRAGEPVRPETVWLSCRPITAADYGALLRNIDALRCAERDAPLMAATRVAVDLARTPIGPRRR